MPIQLQQMMQMWFQQMQFNAMSAQQSSGNFFQPNVNGGMGMQNGGMGTYQAMPGTGVGSGEPSQLFPGSAPATPLRGNIPDSLMGTDLSAGASTPLTGEGFGAMSPDLHTPPNALGSASEGP
eukprot:12430896-Karenia_brevis.AAC.1